MTQKKQKTGLVTKDISETLESLDTTREGVYVYTGYRLPNGEVRTNYFASNQMPRLKAGTDNMKRTLKVSYSSIANENEQLLHQLFSKTRNR